MGHPHRREEVISALPLRDGKSRAGSRQEVAFSWRAKVASRRGCLAQHKPQPGEGRKFSLSGVFDQDKAGRIVWSQLPGH